jgi:uncharacterized protein (DUF2384 family)
MRRLARGYSIHLRSCVPRPRRTLSRREASRQLLSREEADKTVRIARVTARAHQVFGGKPGSLLASARWHTRGKERLFVRD